MKEPAYAICVRVPDLDNPVEGSTKDTCAKCKTDVWLSVASRSYVQAKDATILCAQCGLDQMHQDLEENGEIEIVTNDVQRNEIQRALLEQRL